MKYEFGTYIPDEDIVRRFKDADGEIFLEVRGLEDLLFRVTEGNCVYYKMDKADMEGEELTLLDDFSRGGPKVKAPPFPGKPYESPVIIEEEEEEDIFELNETFSFLDDKVEIPRGPDADAAVIELDEARQVPPHLKSLCKKNGCGGYSLRYGKFIYMLDKNYYVELKTAAADFNDRHGVEEDERGSDSLLLLMDPVVEGGIPSGGSSDRQKEIELQKGEILPLYLRAQCEEDIGPDSGSRISVGSYLYFLDAGYRVTQKMRISSSEEELEDTPVLELPDVTNVPGKKPAPGKPLLVNNIVANLVKTVEFALEKYNISADFYKETVLGPGSRQTLISVYNGDLTQLNDDTRGAADQGKTTLLEEKGFAILKAALVHELYIKSTLAGRGDNMKYFLTYIGAAGPDGTLEKFRDYISLEDQEKMVGFFRTRAEYYTDKTEIIKRVYRHLRVNVFEEYEELREQEKKVLFNAYLIMKLYQQTNRLDRGDGITMIRLTRDLMERGSV